MFGGCHCRKGTVSAKTSWQELEFSIDCKEVGRTDESSEGCG